MVLMFIWSVHDGSLEGSWPRFPVGLLVASHEKRNVCFFCDRNRDLSYLEIIEHNLRQLHLFAPAIGTLLFALSCYFFSVEWLATYTLTFAVASREEPDIVDFIMAPRVCSACICGYNAIDFDVLNNTTCCYKGASECLCLTNERCLALDEEPLGWGMVTNPANKELCKLGLFCCTCGIKEIEVLCAGVEKLLCFSAAQSLPFKAEWGVPQCLCSVCFLR